MTTERKELDDALAEAGIQEIEVGSFVFPSIRYLLN